MTIIDPTTSLGKVRLRVGDWSDLPILPDSVILATIDDCQGNVPRAASLCAQYILATLTSKTHRKLSQLETWSGEHFTNYVRFLQLTVLNPHLMSSSPIPYPSSSESSPMNDFIYQWNKTYYMVESGRITSL